MAGAVDGRVLCAGRLPSPPPELERQVIALRFFHDLDRYAMAKVGYSQMHVSRLLRRALARMRTQPVEP